MKKSTNQRKFRRFGWICAGVLGFVLVGATPKTAEAGGVHLSFGFGVPVYAAPYPVYSYPSYPYYSGYYAYPPRVVYPPVAIGGYYNYGGYRGGYYGGGYGGHYGGGYGGHRHGRYCRH